MLQEESIVNCFLKHLSSLDIETDFDSLAPPS